MKRLAGLIAAFALLVAGIESLRVLSAWWQAGRPPPGPAELLSFAALAMVAVVWWRHSVFACRHGNCRMPNEAGATRRDRAPK